MSWEAKMEYLIPKPAPRRKKKWPQYDGKAPTIVLPSKEVIDAYEHCAKICEYYSKANWSDKTDGKRAAKHLADRIRHAYSILHYSANLNVG